MKTILSFLLSTASFLVTQGVLSAQTEWQIGETTLVEYDLVTGVQIPWEILWGPDDMLWCTTRYGDVLRIDPLSGTYDEVLSLNVFGGSGEPGLLGMAMHPEWDTEPKVFLVYTAGSSWQNAEERLSVFEWNGNALVNEEVLYTVDAGGIHNGSRLLVLPDHTLLMTTGDTGDGGTSSQNPNDPNGKVLRFHLDGSIPADNPTPGSPVFSMGHRNAQGLCLGPNGLIYSSEHGQNNWDEFNIIEAGRNYGWPNVEGECNTPSEQSFCEANDVAEPLKTWSPCIAVNGIEFYDHPAIPEWQGAVLMSVLGGLSGQYERLSVLHMSEDGLTVESEDQHFASFNQRIRDVAINPYTGAVYLAFNGPQYPGSGPNIIKEFRPQEAVDGIAWSEERGIDVFPNPSSGQFQWACSPAWQGAHFVVYDVQGREVASGLVQPSGQLHGQSWGSGTFVLRVQAPGQTGMLTRLLVVK